VWDDFRQAILHDQGADDEDSVARSAIFSALKQRRLDPTVVQMVVTDGSSGLPSAWPLNYPQRNSNAVSCIRSIGCNVPSVTATTRSLIRLCKSHCALWQPAAGAASNSRTTSMPSLKPLTHVEDEQRQATFQATWRTLEFEVMPLPSKDIELSPSR
jgi:hypothetical protein